MGTICADFVLSSIFGCLSFLPSTRSFEVFSAYRYLRYNVEFSCVASSGRGSCVCSPTHRSHRLPHSKNRERSYVC